MKDRWVQEEHECRQPPPGRRGVGSIWQCRCGQRWKLIDRHWVGGGPMVYTYTRWEKVEEE